MRRVQHSASMIKATKLIQGKSDKNQKAAQLFAVSFLSVPICVLVSISVPIYTKNDTDKFVHCKSGTFI